MTIDFPDDLLKKSGLSERELFVEVVCVLFDLERVDFHDARRLLGLERVEFEEELRKRKIAIYRPTVEDVLEDLQTLKDFRSRTKGLPE